MSSGMNGTKSRGVFSSVEEMKAANLRVGVRVDVYGGDTYDIYATDQGGSIALDNGLWADVVDKTVDGYKGLWPDTGGSALKGETWQTQVSGTPTGAYYVALQDTSVTPVNDNVNWRGINDYGTVNEGLVVTHRHGTSAEIEAKVPDNGEIWKNDDDGSLHVGDGVKQGGVKHVNENNFEDYTSVPFSDNYGIVTTLNDQTAELSEMLQGQTGYEIARGVSVVQDGTDQNVTRGTRPYNGPYKFTYGGRKIQKETFGVFDDACALSVWASQEDTEQNTQILGASTGQAIANYGNIDTAAVYMANYAQPAKIQSTQSIFTATTVTVTGLDETILKPYQIIGAEDGSDLYVGLVQAWESEVITVDGWYILGNGTQGTPANGSRVVLNPTTRVWGENCIVEIESNDYANSAVGNETMLNLEKSGSGADSQIFKAINNNLAGEVAASAYDAIGLFREAVSIKQGADTGVKVENAVEYGFRSFQDGDSFASTVAFTSDAKSGASKGADVAFQANNPNIAFKAQDVNSRALQVRQGANERMYIDQSGSIYQFSGVGEGTLVAQFGLGASSGCVIRQAAGSGASAAAAAMQIGKNSTTDRSINAAGTVNMSGADYAEYVKKSESCGVILPGDIVGFDVNGELTDKFSEAVHFGVKSTAPNVVGGDTWFNEPEPDKKPPEWYQWRKQLDELPGLPPEPVKPIKPKTANVRVMRAYEEAKITYEHDMAEYANLLDIITRERESLVASEPTNVSVEYANWQARMEDARKMVDRIAFCGIVPINIASGEVGEYVVAIQEGAGIGATTKRAEHMSFEDYDKSIGKIYKVCNGAVYVVVKSV